MTEAKKDDENKTRYDLIPPYSLERVAHIYTTGAKRYGDRNWEKGLPYSRMYAAMMRHLQAWWMGEDYDTDQPTHHHLASVAWYCLGLIWYQHAGMTELDDRYPVVREFQNTEPRIGDYPKPDEETNRAYIKDLEEENSRLLRKLEQMENEYAGRYR